MDIHWRGDGEELGGVEGGDTIIRMCSCEKALHSKKEKQMKNRYDETDILISTP